MNADRDLERLLDRWLDDGPTQSPDRVLLTAADRIGRQRQRPAWRLQPWRFPTVTFPVRLAAALLLLLVVVLGGTALYVGNRGVAPASTPNPSPTPTPSPTPSPALISSPQPSLAAGAYQFIVNEPTPSDPTQTVSLPISLALPAGWAATSVGASDFSLAPPAAKADDAVIVNVDMRRAAKDASCTEGPEPGIGSTAAELVADLRADPELVVSAPTSVTVGGLQGLAVDIALKPTATRTCPFSQGAPTVPLIVDTIDGTGPYWGIGGKERVHLVVVDRGNGRNLTVLVDSADGSTFDALVAAATPVIESIALQ